MSINKEFSHLKYVNDVTIKKNSVTVMLLFTLPFENNLSGSHELVFPELIYSRNQYLIRKYK
jgi:hypothetical protein